MALFPALRLTKFPDLEENYFREGNSVIISVVNNIQFITTNSLYHSVFNVLCSTPCKWHLCLLPGTMPSFTILSKSLWWLTWPKYVNFLNMMLLTSQFFSMSNLAECFHFRGPWFSYVSAAFKCFYKLDMSESCFYLSLHREIYQRKCHIIKITVCLFYLSLNLENY